MTVTPFAARAILILTLLPFLFYAGRDQILHFKVRRVPILETVVHLALGVTGLLTIATAFRFDIKALAVHGGAFVALGTIDEFVFHRRIPETESDTHAKEHFALFAFYVVAVLLTQITR